MIADDSDGVGVDNGFIKSSFEQQLSVAKDLLTLAQLQDSFGDSVSTVSVFALTNGKETKLAGFLKLAFQPTLKNFLMS